MKREVWLGLLVSLALHAAAIGWWRVHPAHAVPQTARPPERLLEVTLVPHARAPAAAAETPPAPAQTPAPAAETTTMPTSPLPAEAAHGGGPVREGPESANVTGLPVILEAPYIPSRELDVSPQPEAPVVVPFPEASLEKGKVSGILILFVGENGWIDRIEVGESDLPPAFEQAAIETFMQARMQPGVKDGKPSRARMKILVEFEAR